MPAQQQNSTPRTSGSLLFASPARPRKKWPPEDEIISDSEEERLIEELLTENGGGLVSMDEHDSVLPTKKPHVSRSSVIIISSGSEEGELRSNGSPLRSDDPSLAGPTTRHKRKGKARPPLPRVESDSSVICISDTESDSSPPQPSISPVKQRILQRTLTPYAPILGPVDLHDASDNDGAILTFDPHVRAKPVQVSRTPGPNPDPKATASRTKTPASVPTTPRKPKPVPAKQLRLEVYARTFFSELNTAVFDDGLGPETELVWNKRLATTAGRASWKRNRHGETSLKIELSPKVVDGDERLRNTLAHEMCHLAVWVLDDAHDERGHGPKFKAWATRVMRARPDIAISTRHTYEIDYKYKWECRVCGKIYGRHSKSIDHLKRGCGVCKPPGELKPLFETRPRRTPMATKSKLASGVQRESPRAMDRAPRAQINLVDPIAGQNDEVEELIKGIGRVDL